MRKPIPPAWLSACVPLLAWLALLTTAPAQAAPDGGEDMSLVPPRPAGRILDSAHWFTPSEKESARKELNRLFTENEVDVYLVTLPKKPPQGAQTYARMLGRAWSRAPVWCVVFHVPGDPGGFHVEAGGIEVRRGKIDLAIADAVKRARREISEKDRVMAAWKECSEGLRFVHASGKRRNEQVVEVRKNYFAGETEKKQRLKLLLVAAATGLVALLLVAFVLYRLLRRRRFSYLFPETSWRTRFKGPYSGGSSIIVNYRSKRVKKRK